MTKKMRTESTLADLGVVAKYFCAAGVVPAAPRNFISEPPAQRAEKLAAPSGYMAVIRA